MSLQLPPKGHEITPVYTPYHVVQLAIILLKATFNTIGPEDYPFRYDSDSHVSKISIDTVYNRAARIIGKKPTVAVTRSAIQSGQIVQGDLADGKYFAPEYVKTNLINSGLIFRISTRTFAECDIFSNELFNFLVACRTYLPKFTGIHHIQAINMGQPMQSEQDDTIYVSEAQLSYQMQYKWLQIDVQRLIESIHVFLNDEEIYSSVNT